MKWTLEKRIHNVFEYILISKLCFKLKNNDLFYDENRLSKHVEDIFKNNQTIIFNLQDKTSKFFDTITFEEYSLNDKRAVNTFLTKNDIWAFIDSKNSKKLSVFNFENKTEEIVFEDYNWEHIFIEYEQIYMYIKHTIKSVSINAGEYLWEVTLAEYGYQDAHLGYVKAQIRQVIGILGNALIVFMSSGTLVSIDTETGTILWDIPFSWAYYPSDYQGDKWCWHLEGGYLYLLQHWYYLRIDISTQKLEVLWQLSDKRIEIDHCTYSEDYVYFMAINTSVSNIQPSVLGVFNRKSLNIVWQYDQPIASSRPPQSDGNKLYCLDNAGILHIFEKEDVS